MISPNNRNLLSQLKLEVQRVHRAATFPGALRNSILCSFQLFVAHIIIVLGLHHCLHVTWPPFMMSISLLYFLQGHLSLDLEPIHITPVWFYPKVLNYSQI